MDARRRSSPGLLVFGAIVASFLAVTVFTQARLSAIDAAALDIARNASPSIERLTAAREQARKLQVRLREHLDRATAGAPSDDQPIERARRALNEAIADYLRLPVFEGEQDRWGDILHARDALNDSVAQCLDEIRRAAYASADTTLRTSVATNADDLAQAITRGVEFDAEHSAALALRIQHLRDRSTLWALGLDVVCALATIAAAVVIRRATRSRTALVREHGRLLEERASELEQFAGRVAHDVLSPLHTVAAALEIARLTGDEEKRDRATARGQSALGRVKRLVDALLEFARAGARPSPDARADVSATLADLLPELESSAAEAGVELALREGATGAVACDPGVLTSLFSNVARNAIKYIGDGPMRRVEIRTAPRGDFIRAEVQDTGPGLPADLEPRVFEPYLRGTHAAQGGIGLGLATVKKLVDGHGGRLGVQSAPGAGCTFWFELPRAKDEPTAAPAARG